MLTTKAQPTAYPVPGNEEERLAALSSYDVLDTASEPSFEKITALAARLFEAPIALMTLMDRDREWFKAKIGIEMPELAREISFCTHALIENKPLVICDATKDERFRNNPLVTGKMSIRFYASVTLRTRAGLALGTLCVIDTVARERPAQHLLDSLEDLAFLLVEQLEYRLAVAAKSRAEERLQLHLSQVQQEADAALRAKNDFLARISHEIRTPMNLILGMNALLLQSSVDESQRQHLAVSNRNVRRLLRLINGILDLAKVDAGELTFEAAPFDLNLLLNECAATISSAVELKGLRLEVLLDLNTWPYWIGDAERLQQVLLNLISNSIKFTMRGKIEVRVCPEMGDDGEKGLRFEVSDTGCGVPPHKAEMIFEAFQQAEGSVTRSYEGTGLGLAIAKALVERMGGRIWVGEQPAPGAKFVFTVFLPPSTADAVRHKAAGTTAARAAQQLDAGTSVLIVEDNPENVILLRAYLDSLPLALDYATNGVEALKKRQQGSYDIVLMDIQMPIMDGLTATRVIRTWEKEHAAPRVPIVALTAHALNGCAADSLAAGCDGHLTKPIERADLVEAIARYAQPPAARRPKAMADSIAARRPEFLANRWRDLDKMRNALSNADFAAIAAIAHNCKGIGAGYGFPEISSLGAALEKAAKASDTGQLLNSLAQFEGCLSAAAQAEHPSPASGAVSPRAGEYENRAKS